MKSLHRGLGLLLLIGWMRSSANSVATYPCTSGPVNEAALCAPVKSVSKETLQKIASGESAPCSLTFGQYACAQSAWLQVFKNDFLKSLYLCLSSRPLSAMDSMYSILFFSKFQANVLEPALEKFSDGFPHMPLSQEWNMIFFNGIWEIMLQLPDAASPHVLSQWLHGRLRPFVVNPKVFTCLRAKNTSCGRLHQIVAALNGMYSNFTVEDQRNIYNGLKYYLTGDGSKQNCYNAALPSLSSTAWFANYLGSFMEHALVGDLLLFADEPTLQKFARDPVNLQLIANLSLPREMAVYYTLLLTSAPGFQMASLPDRFVCYLSPSAVSHLDKKAALSVAQRITKNCVPSPTRTGTSEERPVPSLTTEERQVATLLVNKFDQFPPETLNALGQAAVGLSVSQIEKGISDRDLNASLPSLSEVYGWNAEKSSTIVNKLFNSSYQILDAQNLAALGSLVAGLSSSRLQSLPPKVILEAVKIPGFAKQIVTMPSALKMALVEKIVSAAGSPVSLVKYVPNSLASYIPKSLLAFGNEKPDLQELNQKPWNREQAAMFFNDVIKIEADFSRLSPSVLQGFTCAAANEMETEKFQQLAKAMNQKNVKLGEDQLSCLVKRVTLNGIPQDLDNYPKDMLLFLSPSDYAVTGSCQQYFANVGEANIDVLQRDSPQRKQLLLEALACLNISGTQVSEENAEVLGHLVCDLGEEYIRNSSGSLLKQLNNCESFVPSQEEAIRNVISSGSTQFGPPSNWSTSTLNELSGLLRIFDHNILQKIPQNILTPWLKSFVHDSPLPREQLASIVKNLLPSRQKRAAECPPDKNITEQVAMDELMPLYYSPEELRACLQGVTLVEHLAQMANYPFTDEQLAVLKEKLDEMYPNGYPEKIIPYLGSISFFVTINDIKKWNITSADTLAFLLSNEPPNDQAAVIITKYTDLGNPLNVTALNAIGTRYICLLTEPQLNMIEPSNLKMANSLDPSACPQSTKDILYPKAKQAFSDQRNLFPAYYNLIKPYLSGAPGEDLKALSKDNVNMDIGTFMSLKNTSVLTLTADDIKGLLGLNLADLKNQQYNSPVVDWIRLQRQSELNKLGLGLMGGIPDGYITLPPKLEKPTSSAPLSTSVSAFHLLPTLLLSFLLTSFLS
ncbi:mesothelin [Emydura macquarii macquarii]|uniref:mesothelin n=1 Tax=Emydura macquarii macquarii TaxID=1129001 RepID=UPI00352AF924